MLRSIRHSRHPLLNLLLLLLLTLIALPAYAQSKQCNGASRQALSSGVRLSKIASATEKQYTLYNNKAASGGLSKRDVDRKAELTEKQAELASVLFNHIPSCGSELALEDVANNWQYWKWGIQRCSDNFDYVQNAYFEEIKISAALQKLADVAARVMSQAERKVNSFCAKGQKIKDRLDKLLDKCPDVAPPDYASPGDKPFGGACWTGSQGTGGGGNTGPQCKGEIPKRVEKLAEKMNKYAGEKILGKFSAAYTAAQQDGFLKRKKDRDRLENLASVLFNHIPSCGSVLALEDVANNWQYWKWGIQRCSDNFEYVQDAYFEKQDLEATAAKVEKRLRGSFCRKKVKYDFFLQLITTLVTNCGVDMPVLTTPPAAPAC